MKITSKNVFCFLSIAGLLWFSGCRGRARIVPSAKPAPKKGRLVRMGYAIQVGAFSVLDNAQRLTQALNQKDMNAYYFLHESGLYKVRFGDFPSFEAARQEAERLLSKAVVEDYFIVKPEDYAVSKQGILGEDYLREKLVATAESFIGVKYSWGGTSMDKGFDCSGLTMAVFQLNGLNLPRSSKEQYEIGSPVARYKAKKGDLVFFITSQRKKISHVGIYVGNEAFIHAPGKDKKIRKDSLLNNYFRKRFVSVRTYLK